MIFVAVDIGGTFTDLIGFDDAAQSFVQAKSLTTPHELTQGVIDCIRQSGLSADAIDELIHGSTIAINTLIERKGAKTGLVVTRGTRDVYIIGRGNRPESYNLFFHRHRPLVSRRLTREVDERVTSDGEVYQRLRKCERRRGLPRAQGRGRRGGRGLLPARLRQSHARARRRCDGPQGAAGCLPVAVARHPARVPRVRAHVDDGGERLHRAEGRRLREEPEVEPRRHRLPRRSVDHALQRRRDDAGGRDRAAGGDDGIGPGRRHHRLGAGRCRARLPQRDLLRHGRHHRQGEPHSRGRADARARLLRRRLRQRPSGDAADDRRGRGRRRRRLDRLARRCRRTQGRPAERRRRSRARSATAAAAPSRPSPTPTWCWADSIRTISSAAR